ncbi:MAG: DUF1858 domain-containing protein [Chloroflexi bacterium]|nr:DUF1858 domain-containing protein [Chloroflexota bacterium]
MDEKMLLAEMTVEDLLKRWPKTAVVFNEHQMACVGCVVAEFYTVAEAANIYDLTEEAFIAKLSDVIRD